MDHYKEFYLLRGRFTWVMFLSLPGMLILLQVGEMTVGVAKSQETPPLDS